MPVCLCYNNMSFSILPMAPKGCCGQPHFVGTSPTPYTYTQKANHFLSLPNFDFYSYWGFPFPLSILFLLWFSFFCAFCHLGFFLFIFLVLGYFFPLLFLLLLLAMMMMMMISVLSFIFPLFFLFCCILGKFIFLEGLTLLLCVFRFFLWAF